MLVARPPARTCVCRIPLTAVDNAICHCLLAMTKHVFHSHSLSREEEEEKDSHRSRRWVRALRHTSIHEGQLAVRVFLPAILLGLLAASSVPVVTAQQLLSDSRPPQPPPRLPPPSPPPPPPRILANNALHPAALDVTAVTTYTYHRARGANLTVSAFGTNTVPGQIHFVSYCERTHNAFHEGHVTLPAEVGAVRSAASVGQYAAWGTDQSPGMVVPGRGGWRDREEGVRCALCPCIYTLNH